MTENSFFYSWSLCFMNIPTQAPVSFGVHLQLRGYKIGSPSPASAEQPTKGEGLIEDYHTGFSAYNLSLSLSKQKPFVIEKLLQGCGTLIYQRANRKRDDNCGHEYLHRKALRGVSE